MVVLLRDEISFPDPCFGEESGLFAVGGDLSPERLLLAYRHGIFPWFAFREDDIYWFCPMQRFVIFPNEVHISHSMRSLINKRLYHVTFNTDFEGVINNCSQLRIDEQRAWLGPDMIAAFTELHRRKAAMSVEVWDSADRLVGGLYGVTFNGCFMGESMFSLVPSASKLALIGLSQWMQANGWHMIDCQFETPHLKSMGGRTISYDDYLKILHQGKVYDVREDDFFCIYFAG